MIMPKINLKFSKLLIFPHSLRLLYLPVVCTQAAKTTSIETQLMEYPIQQRESNEHNLPPRNNSFKIKFRYKFHFIGIKILDAIQIRAQAENLLHSCFRFWVSILTSHVQKSPVVEQWVDFQTALQNTRPFLGKNSFSFSNLDTLLIGWLLRF